MRRSRFGTMLILGTIGAFMAAPAGGQPTTCYQDHVENHNDNTSRRKCYLLCGEHCTGTREAGCQDECDEKWTLTAPAEFQGEARRIVALHGDPAGQHAYLTDVKLWDWLVGVDEPVPLFVVEAADWFILNGADIRIERLASVTMSWILEEHDTTQEAHDAAIVALADQLDHEDYRVRRTALISLAKVRAYRESPELLVELVRAAAMDPTTEVRETAVKLLARF